MYTCMCVYVCAFACMNDVVELRNAQIQSKSGGENEERWRPWTSRYTCIHHLHCISVCMIVIVTHYPFCIYVHLHVCGYRIRNTRI